MTEIETRTYIKELSSKPAFWIKDTTGGYFDIESFGLALIEVFTKSVIKDYKASLVPVAWTITSRDGITVDEVSDYSFYSESDAIAHRDEHCFMECNVVPLYALGETK